MSLKAKRAIHGDHVEGVYGIADGKKE